MAKFIKFVFLTDEPRGTKIWEVQTTYKGQPVITLGSIGWWPRWRKYAYFPASGTLYEEICLRDIADFCEEKTREHKKKKKE